MNKDALLRLIAESAYNIGYAAKKHLATYDLVEKVPGWIGLVSLAVGIFALFMPDLAKNPVAATFIVLGVASITINFYTATKIGTRRLGWNSPAYFMNCAPCTHRLNRSQTQPT